MRNEPVQYYIYIYISSTSTYKDVYYARSADATGRVPQADDGRTDSCISGYARLCTMTRLHRPTACHVRTGAAKPLDLISSACRIRHPRIIRHQKPSQVSMIRPPAHHRRYSAVILPDPETHRLPLGSLSVQLLYISFFFFFLLLSVSHTGSCLLVVRPAGYKNAASQRLSVTAAAVSV